MINQPIPGNKNQKIYTFLDFEINPYSRELKQLKAPVKISKKSFDILLLLVEKQGHVVTKQEIINHVWPNQIVTDAALNKQITRLKNDLIKDDSNKKGIIETVRGVGIKLIPTVKPKQIKRVKLTKTVFWIVPIAFALIMYFVIGFFQKLPELKKTISTIDNVETESYNIVLMPSEKSIDWLNVGGLNYLSEQLQHNDKIKTISPHSQWFDSDETQSLAIEMSQNDGIDYVLAVNNLQKNKIYISQLVLRSNEGIIAKKNIQANSINVLFDKTNSWVTRQLNISSVIKAGQIYDYQTTDFVLESYLRGREVAVHESYEKAQQLFQTATTQDADFLPAWIALAEVEARLGNNEKALALIETIVARSNFNQKMRNNILVIKAKFLVGMNQLEKASGLLDEAINLSEQKNDQASLIDAITIKIQIDFNSGSVSQKTVDLSLKQILLLNEYKPDPYLLALAHFNLSATYQNLGQIDLAIKNANLCINLNTKANNIRGIVIGTSLLARIYKDMGDTGMALLALEKIEGYYEQMDGVDEQQIYLQYKAENLIYHGLRDEALRTIEKLRVLSNKSSSLEPKIIALGLSFELNTIYKNYDQAQLNVKQMLKLLKEQPQKYPPIYNDLILAYDMLIAANLDEPQAARLLIEKNLASNPNIKSFFEKELRMIEATILVKERKIILALQIYHDLVDDYIEANQLQDALYYAGYPILDIQWQNNKQDYVKTMNYLDEISVFKYPIHKYKAQYLAYKKDYINAYALMQDLKSKANQFWTTDDQILLENYQELAQENKL